MDILKSEPKKFSIDRPVPTNYKEFLRWDSDRDGTPDNPGNQWINNTWDDGTTVNPQN